MLSNRPIVQLQKSKVDKAFEALTFTCMAAGWILIAVSYRSLPDIIPIHYDLKGKIDNYGAKEIIWILPFIFTAVVTGIHYLNKYPHIFNYMVEINSENAEAQYKAATGLIRIIQLAVSLVFLILVIDIITSAKTRESFLGAWFVPVLVLLFIVPVIYYLLKTQGRRSA